MPQPDNQRQRGSVTQTSQRQVSPQGQKAANISPISGGAAAAAPVLQIGQQAQIKQTGAELYQMLQGAFQGAAAGLETYQKMYELQSKHDYEKFQQDYVTELDRVKGDPTKMKTWFDSQTYKPNRVTASKYGELRAQINGKAYDEDQRDMWIDDLSKMSQMSTTDALQYLSNRAETEDPNSPWSKQAETKLIELQGEVAKTTRSMNLNAMELTYREDNVRLTETLKAMPEFAQSLDSDAYKLFLASRSLSLASIDEQTGQITLKSGETFDMNTVTLQDMERMKDNMGTYANDVDLDLGMTAFRAANLPASALGRRPVSGTPMFKATAGARTALSSSDPQAALADHLFSLYGSLEPDERAGKMAQVLQKTVQSITTDTEISAAEKARLLGELQEFSTLASSGETLGVGSEEEMDEVLGQGWDKGIAEARTAALLQATEESFAGITAEAASSLSGSQLYASMNFKFDTEVIPMLSELGEDTRIIVTNPRTGESRKLTLEGYNQQGRDLQGFVTTGVEVVNPDFNEKVPFSMAMTPGGFVYIGSGNERVNREIQERASQFNVLLGNATAAERFLGGDQMSAQEKGRGFKQIASHGSDEDIFKAIGVAGSPASNGQDFYPSGENPEVFERLYSLYSPDAISSLPPEVRTARLQEMSLAFGNSANLQAALTSGQGDPKNVQLLETLYVAGAEISKDPSVATPEEFQARILRVNAARNTPFWGNYVASGASLIEDLGSARSEDLIIGGTGANYDQFFEQPEDITQVSEKNQYRYALMSRASQDYANESRGTGSLQEDLKSSDEQTREDAYRYLTANINAQTSRSRLYDLNGSKNDFVLSHMTGTSAVTPGQLVFSADNLYSGASREFSYTAQEEGALALLDMLDKRAQEKDMKTETVARTIGLQSSSEYLRFRSFMRTRNTEGMTEAQARKFTILADKLSSGIILSPADDPSSAVSTLERTDEGHAYKTHAFNIKLTPELLGGDLFDRDTLAYAVATNAPTMPLVRILEALYPDQSSAGLDAEVFGSLPQHLNLTINRIQFVGPSGVPEGFRTGDEIANSRPKWGSDFETPQFGTSSPTVAPGMVIIP